MQKEFVIYQAGAGFTAVTNDVQQEILAALEDGPLQLPDLVQKTGKAKSTLSGIHMKELLNRELVLEEPHPTDARRKVYRLMAKRIGSSDIPVDRLRAAVQQYAGLAGASRGIPLAATLAVLAAAPDDARADTLFAQAKELGRRAGPVGAKSPFEWAQHLEGQELASPLQVDLESASLRVRLKEALEGIPVERAATLLAGLLSGLSGQGWEGVAQEGAVRLSAPQLVR